MNKRAKNTRTPLLAPSITIEAFADRARTAAAGVEHGDDPLPRALRLRKSWARLDPVETGLAPQLQQNRLYVALGKVATVLGETVRVAKNRTNFPFDRMLNEVQRDRVQTGINAGMNTRSLANQLHTLSASERRPNVGRAEVTSRFGELSVEAMLLHLKAQEVKERELPRRVRHSAETVLRASLGNLIFQTVGVMGDINQGMQDLQHQGKDDSHLSGTLVETMYFGYRLMEWYRGDGLLADGYPRFALTREDMPVNAGDSSRRGFDVVVAHGDRSPEFVQVKTSRNSATYAPEIAVWTPAKPGILEHTESIIDDFQAVIINEANDTHIETAWRRLGSWFGNSPQPA